MEAYHLQLQFMLKFMFILLCKMLSECFLEMFANSLRSASILRQRNSKKHTRQAILNVRIFCRRKPSKDLRSKEKYCEIVLHK